MKKNLRVYISGKITGCEDLNKPKFTKAEVWLTLERHTAVNPHKLAHSHDQNYWSYMRVDIAAMLNCDAVIVLDDWHKSNGAIGEIIIAKWVKIPVYAAYTMKEVKISFLTIVKFLLKLV